MEIILADNQDITCAGLRYLLKEMGWTKTSRVKNRKDLIAALINSPEALVILDYSLFDFPDVEILLVVNSRFKDAKWLLFYDDLSPALANRLLINESDFGIVSKATSESEIKQALSTELNGQRYIGQDIMRMLLHNANNNNDEAKGILTPTEKEILTAIAQGKTSKEIAEMRFSSLNTIITHRKNIFRKINVNNIYEATRYALRVGLISQSEYYI